MAFMNVNENVAPTMSGPRPVQTVLACLERERCRAQDNTYF